MVQNRWLYECRLPFLPELQMVDNDLEVFDKRFRKWNSATDLTNYSNFDKVRCLHCLLLLRNSTLHSLHIHIDN